MFCLIKIKNVGWRHGSNTGAPASQVQSHEFESQYWQKKKLQNKMKLYLQNIVAGYSVL
jgi:hypothetical protein